ncbi:MAG: hypothetical protein EOO18_06165 [Chryseobacterium sp.]|nr:MAG: hypothetical protein EOO18_06165 [Chryseobacterium sp.]
MVFAVTKKGLLSHEMIIRTYFHQLIEGIEYIHSQGVAHLDLKLENIMLGDSFELKIIDLQFVAKCCWRISCLFFLSRIKRRLGIETYFVQNFRYSHSLL